MNYNESDSMDVKNFNVSISQGSSIGGKIDKHIDKNNARYNLKTSPSNGIALVSSDGQWTYKAFEGFIGEDKFSVVITDEDDEEWTSIINIQVTKNIETKKYTRLVNIENILSIERNITKVKKIKDFEVGLKILNKKIVANSNHLKSKYHDYISRGLLITGILKYYIEYEDEAKESIKNNKLTSISSYKSSYSEGEIIKVKEDKFFSIFFEIPNVEKYDNKFNIESNVVDKYIKVLNQKKFYINIVALFELYC